MKTDFVKGFRYKGFIVTKSLDINELACKLIELVHEETQASVMAIVNEDPENLFSLSFRTLPESSNGAPHILEHTVLCGSRKYPLKDPFFSMTRRSLNTFMNALTGQDFTCYPAASQVEADFYNLLDVYVDSVFHPLLKPLSFAQEGHRLEFAIPDDPTSALQFKGVVYNEMKGALSSPTTRLTEAINASLFPNSPYGYNSGGDPSEIPSLTHEELICFHKTYYHPSHCLFFFYGNFPLAKHLDFIEEKALRNVEKAAPLPHIRLQERAIKPVKKELLYPENSDDENAEDKSLLGFGFLTTTTLDGITILALNVLDIILMDSDASPLKYALLQSGLCKQASSYLGTDTLEVPFVIILKGCEEDKADAIEAVIRKTVLELIEKGIPQQSIESALHQLELGKMEISSNGSGPFGLSLFGRSALLKQHGGKAEDGLRIHSLFNELRKQLHERPRFLQDLLVTYILNNNHYARITLKPSKTIGSDEAAHEERVLQSIRESLSENKIHQILLQSKELLKLQETDNSKDIELLPKISISDITHDIRHFDLTHTSENNIDLFHHSTFTNHITYADLLFPLPYTDEKSLWTTRLFGNIATQVGAANRNYQENLEYIQEHTGGVGSGFALYHQVENSSQFTPSFYFKGKALYRNADKLFALFFDMATDIRLDDRRRIKELIVKQFTSLSNSLNQNALRYAINLSAAPLSTSNAIMQRTYGLDYYLKLRSIVQNYDQEEEKLLDALKQAKEMLLLNQKPHLVITSDTTELTKYKEFGFYGLADLPEKSFTPWKNNLLLPVGHHQGRVISSAVAFTALAFNTIPYNHIDSPLISIASNLFENKVLHKRVREQGGAYGAGASYSSMTGTFYFYSHSDPNIASTVAAFHEAVTDIAKGHFDTNDLEEAKLGIIQSIDSPIPPPSRADVAYSWWREGKTKEMRRYFKEQILNASADDIVRSIEQHLQNQLRTGTIVCFARRELLETENKKLEVMGLPHLKIEKI